ncbi:MAG: CCA tRNA nucleotidyltransferase [bacterium]|nr:CCA tRNA nucleotidyltransferase [bacterium]
MNLPEPLRSFADAVRAASGRALLIGGAVRDRLLQQTPTDFDVEVYGLSPEVVLELAQALGSVHDVGKAFGVLEVRFPESTIHISLPRRESKIAPGHRGFAVGVDPGMAPEDAARRRDFTMNAIAEDPLTGEIFDPFQGRADLERGVLRVVDADHFGEDPLRVLRAAVFAAHFELTIESDSERVIRQAVHQLKQLHRERVGEEWRKLLQRPVQPSRGLKLLMDWGAIALLHPEFSRLPKTPQHPAWHPEGDVWMHTLLAVDVAVSLVREQQLTTDDTWAVLLATLCHDLGKATTTVQRNGVWRSVGHDAAGVGPTRTFLKAIAANKQTIERVVRLVREHLQPLHFSRMQARDQQVRDGRFIALARRLHPATLFLLSLVAEADHRGRGVSPETSTPELVSAFRSRAEALDILHHPPKPVLTGADLRALGIPPGPSYGDILRRAEQLREKHDISRAELLEALRGATESKDALTALSALGG